MNCKNCPFDPEKQVRPFSNGSEFMNWQAHNCHICVNYENKSKDEDKAKCALAFNLDLGTITGTIPLRVAKGIGCEYEPLYGRIKLKPICYERLTQQEFEDRKNSPF